MTPKNQQELEKLLKARDAKTRMSAKAFKARALEAKEQCLALQKEAEMAALAPGISDAEKAEALDRAKAYSVLALEWERTARLPSDLRETKEAEGSEKGISNRQWGARLDAETEELREAILDNYKPGMPADRLRQKLENVGIRRSKRTCERWIKKIRDNAI